MSTNPLAIDLKKQLGRLLELCTGSGSQPHLRALQNASSRATFLTALSGALLEPSLTTAIAHVFRPILIDLCSRWLDNRDLVEDKFEALCLLVQTHEELFPILSSFLRDNVTEEGPLAFVLSAPSVLDVDTKRLHRLLLAYYRVLEANGELPLLCSWPLEPLSALAWAPHPDPAVRFMAVRCYALQSGMGEGERERMEVNVVGRIDEVDCPLYAGLETSGKDIVIDAWVVAATEARRVHAEREAIGADDTDFYGAQEPILQSELSSSVVDIHGVLIFRQAGPTQPTGLIPTSTSIAALQNLALHISLSVPTLLTSAPSAGKSLFLSHLAAVLHPGVPSQIVTLPLADTSLDPRALLGSYISSPTKPGTFEWREGVLVRAMRAGRWLVLEDIDKGSAEVLGTLAPLAASLAPGVRAIGGRARLNIPGWEIVIAEESFRLFATRSVPSTRNGTFPKPTFFAAHKFTELVIGTPDVDELQTIVDARFPRLRGAAATGAIALWAAIKDLGSGGAGARPIGLRELDKFCSRLSSVLPASFQTMDMDTDTQAPYLLPLVFTNPSLHEDIFLEARDVFFGAGSTTSTARAHGDAMAALAAEHLALAVETRDALLHTRAAEFTVDRDANGNATAVRAGRARLPAAPLRAELLQLQTQQRPFAMHRPARALLARIGAAITLAEPVLLTGETGTGKTSAVTHLAGLLRRNLVSLNLSQQSEGADLVGGFKPVEARIMGGEIGERWTGLFRATFSSKKNPRFEGDVQKGMREGKWKRVVGLWRESARIAKERITSKMTKGDEEKDELDSQAPRKRRKTDGLAESLEKWTALEEDVTRFEVQHVQGKGKFAFSFVEGPLVKALRSGDWILLDEINLASPETLEAVSGLLSGPTASITLTEQGSLEPVPRHPDFRLFACMNPATDVGKKDLPPHIRSRFTEIDVPPPDADRETLLSIVAQYIGGVALGDKAAILDVAEFYSSTKALAESRQLADGANHRPHFSMRTLARALTFAADIAPMYSLRRALWEGCLMAFTMALDAQSAKAVTALAEKHLLHGVKNVRSLLKKEPPPPAGRSAEEFVKFGPFYLERGPLPLDAAEDYIITPSVSQKLIDLSRIVSSRRYPVLIEGPTSAGKTSAIEYLARRTGHRFVRINNHEHTDIQEYLGTYVSDPATGALVWRDGLLVQALRQGDWLVLDELNLAPTDVLEALNRLLDDNRELVLPATGEVLRPHPSFVLFATQNPPGLYAGRKVLSRAFRNRFLEVHFADVPQAELERILCERARIAPSYATKIVTVFQELQKRRQAGRVFESKHAFATLRDLFRWAGRDAVGYQELAENGYMLLAERARRADDRAIVQEVIEEVMRPVKIDPRALYDLEASLFAERIGFAMPSSADLVWTSAMRRLLVLLGRALRFDEPVLLVGETGTGKTSVVQVFADAVGRELFQLSCHQNTETADLIGGLRPLRNRAALETEAIQEATDVLVAAGMSVEKMDLAASLDRLAKQTQDSALALRAAHARGKLTRLGAIFEWHDGPLVTALRSGSVFLLDEISLADDSVLERLNSVLEPARTVVLAERAGGESVTAAQGFKLVATMNPGGDYGKKELSPALRNRFTEIWVPAVEDRADLEGIVNGRWAHEALRPYTAPLLDFCEWLGTRVNERSLLGLRDILAWVSFSNSVLNSPALQSLSLEAVFHHAAHLVCLDGLGSLPILSSYASDALAKIKVEATTKLQELVPPSGVAQEEDLVDESESAIRLGLFAIPRGPLPQTLHAYNIEAPTTRDNAMRVARACQLPKPILLEGSPGVGKTSLIVALAKLCGHHLCRINLSDQTDLADLFGTDLPVEGGKPGEFAWKDAEFLIAMQQGHWVLLDEMNLAPQSVLEGLNAVLDHRGTVFIPELGRSFSKHPSFRIFAAQNPIAQGGGRKGLPKSYVNRFTKVYVEALTAQDLHLIGHHLFPDYPEDLLHAMIDFNSRLQEEIAVKHSFGGAGSPWEFNLRDIARWGAVLRLQDCSLHPVEHLRSIYLSRFRSEADRSAACALFTAAFGISADKALNAPHYVVAPKLVQVGHYVAHRSNFSSDTHPQLLQSHLAAVETMGVALEQQWLVIVTGPRESGKTSLVRLMADLAGAALHEVSVNNSTDTTDILGSFEQVDGSARARGVIRKVLNIVDAQLRSADGSRARLSQSRQLWRLVASSNPIDSTSLQMALSLLEQFPGVDDHIKDMLSSSAEALATTTTTEGRFEWVDGPLVRALKEGHWLLLDNANLCNPSVLDRLNALCEPGGVLTLNEQGIVNGAVPVIAPHPNFRLVMCVDPQHGELSRAMRNRGIEVCISLDRTAEDLSRLQVSRRLPKGASPDPVAFEARRRGLTSPLSATDLNRPSGRLLGDSITSYNKDLAATVLSSSESPLALSSLLFLTRSLLTSRSAAFLRLLACEPSVGDLRPLLQLLNTLASDGRWSKIEAMRRAFASIWPVSSDLLCVEPADFFAKFAVSSPTHPQFADVAMQHSLLRAIDIVVRSVAQEIASPDGLVVPDASPVQSAQDKLIRDVLIGVNTIHQAVRAVSPAFFSDTTFNVSSMSSTGVDALHSLQKMAAFLLHSTHGDVNLSAIQTITKWMSATMKDASSSFGEVDGAVGALSRLVTPSTGLGLTEIWSAMRGPTLPRIVLTLADSLQLSPDVRRELVNLYAMADLPGTASERSAIANAIEAVHARLASLSPEALGTDSHASQAYAIAVKQLDAVIRVRLGGTSTDATAVENFLALAYAHAHIDVQSLVSYRTAAWSLKEDRLTVAAASAALKSWHEALWASDAPGPALLVRPTELMTLFATCDWQTVALDALGDFETGLARQAGLLTFGDSEPRSEKIALLYRNTILLIVCCFPESFDASVQQQLLGASSWIQLHSLLAAASHPGLSAALDALTTSVNSVLSSSSSQTQPSVLSDLGRAFIRLFHVFVSLYVPDTPLDPAVAQQCEDAYWSTENDGLSAQLALHAELERRTTSNSSNGVIDYLGTDLDVACRHLRVGGEDDTPASRPVARLREYWLEVSQFLSGVVSAQKIDQIIALTEVDAATAVSRENVVQDSIRGFMQRMRSVYGDFEDIDGPLQLALLQLRFGLRLATSAIAVNKESEVSSLARDLVSLPTISVISPLVSRSAADLHTANVVAFDYLLLQLTGITTDYDAGANLHSHISNLDVIFEQAVRLSLIDQARQEEMEAAGQSLYRSKAIESETINDSEIEMEEFLALFPDYENVLDEKSDVDEPISTLPSASHAGSARTQALAEAYMHLFASSGARRRVDPTARFVQLRKTAAQQLLRAHGDALPDALDIQSHGFSLAMLHHRLQSVTHRMHSFGKAYDFYLDANVPEVRKATQVVQAMARRLRVIITEWPEQMVLQHLLARCEQVLRLNIHSPVAKVLAAIEQLLVQSEDWEMYANRENTLKEHREALTALIVEWRRLELVSWQGLLERQEAAFQDAVSEWWSRIYNACIRGLFDIVESEGDLDKFLDELVPLVESFVTSSPLGQYERRLDTLLGFERWIKMLAQKKSAVEAAALLRVFRVIASTRAYYAQFVPQVVASLSMQRNALEKNIKDFIKLASWRDVNVQSLKASAKRTHIQLYKSIRKFRDILRQPVLPLLRAEHASGNSLSIKFADYTASTSDAAATITVPSTVDTSAPAHLQNLSRTFERFSSLITSRVDTFLGSSPHSALRDLAHEVITTANDLANEPLPTDGPAERRGKLAKALLVRKRKAWSDLLKELKRIGMAYNVQPQVLEQQRSARWLREQSVIPSADHAVTDVAHMETYYMRLLGLLPQLRSSLSSHNEDIQTRELLRGVNLLESGLAFALDARSRLADGLNSYTTLRALVERIQSFEGTRQIATSGPDLQSDLQRQHDDLARLAHALAESTELCNMLSDLPSTASAPADLLVELTSLRAESLGLRDQLSGICSRMPASAIPIVLLDEYEVTTASTELIKRVNLRLRQWTDKEPRIERILTPVREWAETLATPFPAIHAPLPTQDSLDTIVDSLLVTIQTLIAAVPEPKNEEADGDDDNYVKSTNALFFRLTSLLQIDAISEKLAAAFDKIATCSQEDLARIVPRIVPFVRRYEQLVGDHLSAMALWTGSLFKLEFVVCSVMLSVATKGFCTPPDLDDAGDEGEGGEAVGGVGLGDGTGNQDVSKEIEDESQVEGLQGEQDAEQQKREKGQDEGKDAIEMGDDFEGEMEDVPEDEEGDEKDEKDDGEEEEGPDDQVGDLDPLDPSAVDEKLWGDEKGPEGKDDDGKTQDDRSKEAGAESEVVAKEKEGSKKEKEKENGESGKEQQNGDEQEGDEKQDDAIDEEGGEEDGEEQEGEAQGQGAAMDDFVKDADTLDLPDDLDLGPEDQKSDAGDEDDEMDELEDDADIGDETRDAGGRDSAEPEPMDEDGGDGADAQAQAQAGEDAADDAEEDQMDEEQGGATAAPDVQPGEQADTDEANPDSMNAEARESAAQNQSTTTTGGAGQSAGKGADANDDEGAAEDQDQAGDVDQQQDEATGVGALKSGPQQGTSTSQESRSTDMQSNPLRSLGDAVQEIRQRFDDILNSAAEETAPPKLADVSEPSQLEYLRPDDDSQNMQALGPAGAEEAARLQDLKLIDDESDALQDDVAPMDVDEPTAPDTAEPHPSSAALPSQQTAQSLQPGVEDALTQHQLRTPGTANMPDAPMDDATIKAEEDIEEALPDEIVEAELRRWKADGQQSQDTEHLWRLYESLTHELSYALCEQLRLILEPTQATRLKGDYRTGKRLNMKKIIPYIASEYTKDKIWLRRTRPSQREYQVLIALDDSRSMSESHSVHLAYQTLALVSKALTRLEVGDVGIAKFGEAVEVLHGFDEGPFTDQAGTKVMGAFNFNQRATNVLSLVDTSLKILEEARERRAASSSSAADLWQLEIIISDGICQDHEKLRTVLRKAEEQRVMVVFIVIDSLQSNADAATGTSGGAVQDSIVSMKHASYAVVDGRMELQVNRYLDTFPFEYYVVLRNVEALPEVLAGTLKQFFERVSED